MVADLSLSLGSRGHDVEVFNLGVDGVYAKRLSASGITVHKCSRGRVRIPGLTGRLRRPLARFQPDILHAHSGTWYLAASARRGLPASRLVFTDHGRYPSEGAFQYLVQRWSATAIDCLVAVSAPLAEHVQHVLRLKSVPVIENGIDLAPYAHPDAAQRRSARGALGFHDDDVVIVIVGRLEPVKNHDGLIGALARAAVRAPSLRLVVVGSGSLEQQLRTLAQSMGVSDAVRFLGFRSDIPQCLLACDIFAMPSHTEGLPLALLEGMAAGLPVVASPVGGIPAALGNYPEVLLPPADDTAQMAESLERLARDAELRTELGARLRARADSYSLERMTSRYESLYRSCRTGAT